jgi:hypothetical protein
MTDYTSDGHIFNKTVTFIGVDPGANGAMSFGKAEWIGGKLKCHKINKIVEVSPQKWMKFWQEHYNIKLPKDKRERKAKLKSMANLYSSKTPTTLWNADSILIAQYGFEQEKERVSESRKDI